MRRLGLFTLVARFNRHYREQDGSRMMLINFFGIRIEEVAEQLKISEGFIPSVESCLDAAEARGNRD